ncbi:cytochrome c oxidase subunit 2A [Paenibacillus roseipurpureus]|uniref:Cytochrome c oxidase subunit 2A n=1 Tax=Paenibacillus roseopurpureus TaxID=2918901 RepID=A0AA96LQM2_9BACL|nr:cytochrome c oxidase subunit 2A [Paenibacillus sp. MBLB1832]WNR44229.1 cytochrome c oxidase subunit 2A [Paenibacillus sp. MBLB1832]
MDGRSKHSRDSEFENNEQEPLLNGTFAAVLLLGLFLVVSWVAVFLLFMSRQ